MCLVRSRSLMPFSLIHRLAVVLIIVTMIVGATGFFIVSENLLPLPMRIGQTMLYGALWGFLALKVWKRPRTWSLGVALLVTASFLFQAYTWLTAGSASTSSLGGQDAGTVRFVLLRVPAVMAAVSCFWLYRVARKAAI